MSTPGVMRAIQVTAPGGPEALVMGAMPVPRPSPGEVLIRVQAAGVNHADLLQRQGRYPSPAGASTILGLEVSGHIAQLGPQINPGDAGRWRVGDSVIALLRGGGYAEYCAAPSGQCLPVPGGISLTEAAAIPEAYITVWANLFEPRRLNAGDLFLVQGGSSGVGAAAIQTARCFGARVAVTAGSDEKCRFAMSLGAEQAVNYRTRDWAAELEAWSRPPSNPHGIDVIFDIVGGSYLAKHLDLLAMGGRLVQIAFLGGSWAALDLSMLMSKRLLITGSMLRSRSVEEKTLLASAVEHHLWPFFAAGRLQSAVTRVFPLSQAAEAHRFMESGRHMGKLVLEVD